MKGKEGWRCQGCPSAEEWVVGLGLSGRITRMHPRKRQVLLCFSTELVVMFLSCCYHTSAHSTDKHCPL